MNIAAIQTFLAVVRAGNLNKAAEQLNVTQSTVTARLDALDETLGQRLLVRSRKGAHLTKAGFAFERHAELLLQTWEQGRKAVGLPKGFLGIVSLACQSELWTGIGEQWVDVVQAAHPEMALEVWPGEPAEIRRWLSGGLVDVAFTLEPVTGDGVASRAIMRDRLVQVATIDRDVQAWDLAYIYVDLGPAFRRGHRLAWPGDDTPRITYADSNWALEHLLRKGGSAYLPWRLAEAHVAAGRLFPVRGADEFSRPVYFNWREASAAVYAWLSEAIAPGADDRSGAAPKTRTPTTRNTRVQRQSIEQAG
ncbi:MAG: LysR family transcriptional regulator [Dongiaceae bacterium]